MNAGTKLAAYGAGLVLIFGAAAGAGKVIGPDESPAPVAADHADMPAAGKPASHPDVAGAGKPASHPDVAGAGKPESHADMGGGADGHVPGGLQIAEDGYRLQPVTTSLGVGATRTFAFRVL